MKNILRVLIVSLLLQLSSVVYAEYSCYKYGDSMSSLPVPPCEEHSKISPDNVLLRYDEYCRDAGMATEPYDIIVLDMDTTDQDRSKLMYHLSYIAENGKLVLGLTSVAEEDVEEMLARMVGAGMQLSKNIICPTIYVKDSVILAEDNSKGGVLYRLISTGCLGKVSSIAVVSKSLETIQEVRDGLIGDITLGGIYLEN